MRTAGRNIVSGSLGSEAYYGNWPDKCPYNDDLNWACSLSIKYLTQIAPMVKQSGKIGMVVFDIDDTLLMGDPAQVLPGSRGDVSGGEWDLGTKGDQNLFFLYPNPQVVKVATVAHSLGFKNIMLTARPQTSRMASIMNLKLLSIPFDSIIMNDKDKDPLFKVKVRRALDQQAGQTVVLTIGDQICDVLFPNKAAAIKLPEPDLKCSYAYFP